MKHGLEEICWTPATTSTFGMYLKVKGQFSYVYRNRGRGDVGTTATYYAYFYVMLCRIYFPRLVIIFISSSQTGLSKKTDNLVKKKECEDVGQ